MIFERERPPLKWSKQTQGTRELYFLKISMATRLNVNLKGIRAVKKKNN